MNVFDIMTTNPITIRLNASLGEALQLMEEHDFKHIPVLSLEGHLIGILSDRDCRQALNSPYILRERWQDEALISQLQVRAMMSPAPIIIEPNASAAEAARLMLTHQIGCLPVMRGESLVGIVTRSDILVAFMTMHERYEELIQHLDKKRLNTH